MSKKPGVLIYFELLPMLEKLSNEDRGILFYAIMYYGKYRQVPELSDALLVVWPLIQQRLDNDEMRYINSTTRKLYAAYTRWEKEKGNTPLSFVEWQQANGYAVIDEEYIPRDTFIPGS